MFFRPDALCFPSPELSGWLPETNSFACRIAICYSDAASDSGCSELKWSSDFMLLKEQARWRCSQNNLIIVHQTGCPVLYAASKLVDLLMSKRTGLCLSELWNNYNVDFLVDELSLYLVCTLFLLTKLSPANMICFIYLFDKNYNQFFSWCFCVF